MFNVIHAKAMYPSVKTSNVSAGYTVATKARQAPHPKNNEVILKRKHMFIIVGFPAQTNIDKSNASDKQENFTHMILGKIIPQRLVAFIPFGPCSMIVFSKITKDFPNL